NNINKADNGTTYHIASGFSDIQSVWTPASVDSNVEDKPHQKYWVSSDDGKVDVTLYHGYTTLVWNKEGGGTWDTGADGGDKAWTISDDVFGGGHFNNTEDTYADPGRYGLAGDAVIFTDATPGTIKVTHTLHPGTMTVSGDYTFDGTKIGGDNHGLFSSGTLSVTGGNVKFNNLSSVIFGEGITLRGGTSEFDVATYGVVTDKLTVTGGEHSIAGQLGVTTNLDMTGGKLTLSNEIKSAANLTLSGGDLVLEGGALNAFSYTQTGGRLTVDGSAISGDGAAALTTTADAPALSVTPDSALRIENAGYVYNTGVTYHIASGFNVASSWDVANVSHDARGKHINYEVKQTARGVDVYLQSDSRELTWTNGGQNGVWETDTSTAEQPLDLAKNWRWTNSQDVQVDDTFWEADTVHFGETGKGDVTVSGEVAPLLMTVDASGYTFKAGEGTPARSAPTSCASQTETRRLPAPSSWCARLRLTLLRQARASLTVR
ncbi:MAG: hypothetical protein J5974_01055, partial [Pyramidobacter sp.]|nr:hypothetical protein [Pyramidobacter sp.]